MKAFRSVATPLLLALFLTALFAPAAYAAPSIDVWYGLTQDLALPGTPQVWFNIPGNVSGASGLSFTLRGGSSVPLTIGPDDRRLANAGDFNIDLAISDLVPGANEVVITATGAGGPTSETVTVNYTNPGVTWPIPTTINWSDHVGSCVAGQPCENINDVAHVVDGEWELTAAGVRTLNPGYDRAIALGDIAWDEYEITVPITIHTLGDDRGGTGGGGVGFLTGWQGHTDTPVVCGQPKCGFTPLGAIAWYRTNVWTPTGEPQVERLQLYGEGSVSNGTVYLDSAPKLLEDDPDTTYVFKLRVENAPTGSPRNAFSFKVWEANAPMEPAGWEVEGEETFATLNSDGSVLLLSHLDDVTFGNVCVKHLDGECSPITNDDAAAVRRLGTVPIDVVANDEAWTDAIAAAQLDPTTVSIVDDAANGTTSVDPVTGVVTFTHTVGDTTTDSFTYTVEDLEGNLSTETTVSIAIDPIADRPGLIGGNGQWHLPNPDGVVESFYFGVPGDFALVGDWDCDGIDTPGLYRQSTGLAYLRNSNTTGVADVSFIFGIPGDIPIVGDFDGDGCDTLAVYRHSHVFIINELGEDGGSLGSAEYDYWFGVPSDAPFTGDFDADGIDELGLFREGSGLVYFTLDHPTSGAAVTANEFFYGIPGDKIIAGDWTNDGTDTVGIFRASDSTFYLRYSNSLGAADEVIEAPVGSWPVAGGFLFPG